MKKMPITPEIYLKKLVSSEVTFRLLEDRIKPQLCESIEAMKTWLIPLIENHSSPTRIVVLGGSRSISKTFLQGIAIQLPPGNSREVLEHPIELRGFENTLFYRSLKPNYVPLEILQFLAHTPQGQVLFIDDRSILFQKAHLVIEKMKHLFPSATSHFAVFSARHQPQPDTSHHTHTMNTEPELYNFLNKFAEALSDYGFLVEERNMPVDYRVNVLLLHLLQIIVDCSEG
jgi:hypothetical protein